MSPPVPQGSTWSTPGGDAGRCCPAGENCLTTASLSFDSNSEKLRTRYASFFRRVFRKKLDGSMVPLPLVVRPRCLVDSPPFFSSRRVFSNRPTFQLFRCC